MVEVFRQRIYFFKLWAHKKNGGNMPKEYVWEKTTVRGLRFRYHPKRARKKGLKIERDVFYQYRHVVDGKRLEENLGWLFEGMTFEKAITKIHELKQNRLLGTGPVTLKEKQAERRKFEAEQKKIEYAAEKLKITVSDAWNKYLPISQATKLNPRGWKREIPLYEKYVKPVIGNMPMVDVRPIHLERIKKDMAEMELAPRTITYALAVTRQIFNFAIRNNLFAGKNPVSDVKKPSSDNARTRFFSPAEADTLLKEFERQGLVDVYGMALLAFRCGLRAAEILKLTWGTIDFENEQIHIMDTKSKRNRFAFMTLDLKSWLKSRHNNAESAPQQLIFNQADGRPYLEIPKIFQRTVDLLGFNNGFSDRRHRLVFHSCRHSFASWHAMAGTDLAILQKLLGHETFAMVLRYAHLKPDTLKAAVKRLESTRTNTAEIIPLPSGSKLI